MAGTLYRPITSPCHRCLGEHDVQVLVCHGVSFGTYLGSYDAMVPRERLPSTSRQRPQRHLRGAGKPQPHQKERATGWQQEDGQEVVERARV